VTINIGENLSINDYWTSGYTCITIYSGSAASGTGYLNSITLNVHAAISGLKVGTFYQTSGSNYTNRDYTTIGSATVGAHTYAGLNIAVTSGDFIGHYNTAGSLNSHLATGAEVSSAADGFVTPLTNYMDHGGTCPVLYGSSAAAAAVSVGLFTFHG